MINYTPILLFTYSRPIHTKQTVEALLKNEEAKLSDLIIYSDAPKNKKTQIDVSETRKYLRTITGFKSITIIERKENYGLAKNIIDGVTYNVNKYGKVIVLEDDLVTSPYFLKYMNEALIKYQNEEEVISIHGYVYPTSKKLPETFFIKGADCWGWATWKRGWDIFNPNAEELLKEIEVKQLQKHFDFDYTYPYVQMLKDQIAGKCNSWAIRWLASAYLKDKYTLYPGESMVRQIGMDGMGGTHCNFTNRFDVELKMTPINLTPNIAIQESPIARKAFKTFFFSLLSKKEKIKCICKYVKSIIV